ncbi:MAG: hypothetical protein COV29_00925 [Candidatus Yanofskybacteria bacterium CG10_big_fil_rev_8_21_14_0_10_36_16]|uniref:30S ribosomal protein S21 n=1 Tax=Candidatus Yanofskybacteria bacterium CG10_big_fil_rev_8_21_14_0_10_36_16 TaxID=1975096 RepID=A0A2J0QBQ6_9BACT|nr:MAG: hypothetical protein COV29_00925 [Candidatus Yanofskybacteria bacterium CG10_big_fil_rev_8_21_14_0_10_36_16]
MDVKRRQNESTGAMLRRFSRLTKQTDYLKNAKEKQYSKRNENERKEKNRAIMREHLRGLRERLKKFGEYSEDKFREEKKKLKQHLDI